MLSQQFWVQYASIHRWSVTMHVEYIHFYDSELTNIVGYSS